MATLLRLEAGFYMGFKVAIMGRSRGPLEEDLRDK
jgi:hypothetical protein